MISAISTNYSGRRVDLSLFPRLLLPNAPVEMEVSRLPMSIAGPAKAAQGFVKSLLTAQGEIPGDPTAGTNFFARISNSSIRYPSDMEHLFLIESSKAVDAWNESSAGSRPLDEQINRVALVGLEIGIQGVSISIELFTRAGESTTFLLPVNWSK
jgi:hypothetical protein